MKEKISILITICFVLVLCFSCTFKTNDPGICFSQHVLPILVSNCAGCHKNLTTYEGVILYVEKGHPLRSELYKQVKGSNPKMPPDSHKLTAKQVHTLKTWISMGAPNTTNCSVCDTSEYKFKANIQPIMNNWCVDACHNSSNPSGGYDLSNYDNVNAAVNNGLLMGCINQNPGYSKMPKNYKLSACSINKIQNWVNAGHLNN